MLPKCRSEGATGYDLAMACDCVIPSQGRVVQTGLVITPPPGTYVRIAPDSGLAMKKFLDVGIGLVDNDY